METLLVVPLIGAICTQIGAGLDTQRGLDTQATRKEIREFIVSVNPRFPYADEAANQLIYAQSIGGADARLVAAMIAQERRWSLRPNPPYTAENLCQVLHSTGRRVYGRSKARSWQENILWGSWYLQRCLRANGFNVTDALREYNGGPEWDRKGAKHKRHTAAYAKAVRYYRGRMP